MPRTMVCVLPDPVEPYAKIVVLIPCKTPDTKSRTVPLYTSSLVACGAVVRNVHAQVIEEASALTSGTITQCHLTVVSNATSNVYRFSFVRFCTWSR
jgi:hypothetical protein